ncbi:unnamed protein product, partial [Amoebophrya sp. A25]
NNNNSSSSSSSSGGPVKPEEEPTCLICFEELTKIAKLPCECTVHYCLRCWDRALATQFSSQCYCSCPTCRRLVRVDIQPRVSMNQFVGRTPTFNKHWILLEKKIMTEAGATSGESCLFNVEDLYDFHFSLEERSKGEIRRLFGEEIDRIGDQVRPVQIYLLYATALANA